MAEKKPEKKRYWLTFLLKDLDVGETFSPQVLHLTIIPWFVSEKPEEEVADSFRQYFSQQLAFTVGIGREDEFKNKRKIPINLVGSSPALHQLHQKALAWFEDIEARWAVKKPHVGSEFIPHIRRRQGHNPAEGDKLTVSSLSLVSASRRGDDRRTVIGKVIFNAKA